MENNSILVRVAIIVIFAVFIVGLSAVVYIATTGTTTPAANSELLPTQVAFNPAATPVPTTEPEPTATPTLRPASDTVPPNNLFQNRVEIETLPFMGSANLRMATGSEQNDLDMFLTPCSLSDDNPRSAWYSYTPQRDEIVEFHIFPDYPQMMLGLTSSLTGEEDQLVCGLSTDQTYVLEAGTTYYIRQYMHQYDASFLDFEPSFEVVRVEYMATNTTQEQAELITDLPFSITGRYINQMAFQNATYESGCSHFYGVRWYQFTPTDDLVTTISVDTDFYGMNFEVLQSESVDDLLSVSCYGNIPDLPAQEVHMEANTTYYMVFGSDRNYMEDREWEYTLNIEDLTDQQAANFTFHRAQTIESFPLEDERVLIGLTEGDQELSRCDKSFVATRQNSSCDRGGLWGVATWYSYNPTRNSVIEIEVESQPITEDLWHMLAIQLWQGAEDELEMVTELRGTISTRVSVSPDEPTYIRIVTDDPSLDLTTIRIDDVTDRVIANSTAETSHAIEQLPYSARIEADQFVADAWYTYTPPERIDLVFDVRNAQQFEALHISYQPDPEQRRTEFATGSKDEPFIVSLEGGQTYWFRFPGSYVPDAGALEFSVDISRQRLPENRFYQQAKVINSLPFEENWRETDVWYSSVFNCGQSFNNFWYQYTAQSDGMLRVQSKDPAQIRMSVWEATDDLPVILDCAFPAYITGEGQADRGMRWRPNQTEATETGGQRDYPYVSNDFRQVINLSVESGKTYYVSVSRANPAEVTTYGFEIAELPVAPQNFVRENAMEITTFPFTGTPALNYHPAYYHPATHFHPSVKNTRFDAWYTFTAESNAIVQVSAEPLETEAYTLPILPPRYDSSHSLTRGLRTFIFEEDDEGRPRNVSRADYREGRPVEVTEFNAEAGRRYFIAVGVESITVRGNRVYAPTPVTLNVSIDESGSGYPRSFNAPGAVTSLPFTVDLNLADLQNLEGEPSIRCDTNGTYVWYTYTPSQTEVVEFKTNFDLPVVVAILDSDMELIFCVTKEQQVKRASLVAGQQYYFRVEPELETNFTIDRVEVAAFPNHSYSTAIQLDTLPVTIDIERTMENGIPIRAGFQDSLSRGWYIFTPDETMQVRIDLDSIYQVRACTYNGIPGTEGVQTVCAEPASPSYHEFEAGETYYIQIIDLRSETEVPVFEATTFTMEDVTDWQIPNNSRDQAQVVTALPYEQADINTAPGESWYQYTPSQDQQITIETVAVQPAGSYPGVDLYMDTGDGIVRMENAEITDEVSTRTVVADLRGNTTYYISSGYPTARNPVEVIYDMRIYE